MERGGAVGAGWKAGSHIRARSGDPTRAHRIPGITPRDGRTPAESGRRAQDRRVMSDACSPGKIGAISCPVAGRARKGAGRRHPYSPKYDSLITPDPSRALHVRPWDGNALRRVGDPRAGRVSEGRTRWTWSQGCTDQTAPPL